MVSVSEDSMKFTPPPTVHDGDLWSAASQNTYVADNFAVGANGLTGAKGDLFVGSDYQDGITLPIGTNWSTLVADSTTREGVKWASQAYGASVLNPGSQSIPTSLSTSTNQIERIAFPVVISDPHGMFDTMRNLFTIPPNMGEFWQITISGYMTGIAADVGGMIQLGLSIIQIPSPTAISGYRWRTFAMNVDGFSTWINYVYVGYFLAGAQIAGNVIHRQSDARSFSQGRMSVMKMR